MRPAWVNEPATFAMELAGEQPSPRPAVRDGMKQELYESRCSHRGSKSKGVGRDFRGCTGRCSNPSASASLASQNDDEFVIARDPIFRFVVFVRQVFVRKS